MTATAIIMYILAGLYAGLAVVSFWQWVTALDVESVVYRVPGVPFTFDYRGYVTGWDRSSAVRFAGRRANARPRVRQVWRSSDPRRLSAFRILCITDVKGHEGHVDALLITKPGINGRTWMRIPLARFAVLGSKGYTRVS